LSSCHFPWYGFAFCLYVTTYSLIFYQGLAKIAWLNFKGGCEVQGTDSQKDYILWGVCNNHFLLFRCEKLENFNKYYFVQQLQSERLISGSAIPNPNQNANPFTQMTSSASAIPEPKSGQSCPQSCTPYWVILLKILYPLLLQEICSGTKSLLD